MKKILFDTDILIEHIRGNERIQTQVTRLLALSLSLAYTPVSEAEIFRGLRSNEREKTKVALGVLECLPIDRDIGRRAGEYMRSYSKSHGLELPDALVAATAHIHR